MKPFLFLLPFIGSALALTIRRAEAKAAPCTCEPVYCAQSWPDSCYCANDAKKACYDKCGGNVPVYEKCPPRDVAARAPEPEPEPEPEPTTPPSTCVCEQVFCVQSWPESCHCQNNAKKACFEKCGGKEPTYQTCPPVAPPALPAPVARSESTTECKCTQVNCIMKWPEGCYCSNYAKELCYKECGGKKPVLSICPPLSTPSLTTKTIAARQTKPTNQVCGGARHGSPFPACPAGQSCIRDPFARGESCGPACGEAGICVENKMCGGIMGRACDKKGQVCVGDPRDDCDPLKGGADCAGVCVWPQ